MAALKQPTPDGLANDERWAAVQKIANSEEFRRSPRLREFLFYVAAQQLNGHPEEITEHNVGHRVYHRSETYNPTEDNIVRVSARQLRVKLREYYESEGSCDNWIVEIPKGGYVPVFRSRETPSAEKAPREAIIRAKRGLPSWLITVLVASAAALAAWFIPHASPQPPTKPDPNLVTTLFRGSRQPVEVVVSDSTFSLMQSMLHRTITLDEYASQSYRHLPSDMLRDPEARRAWNALLTRQLVNVGDVGATSRFANALAISGNTSGVIMRSAQDVRARDFRSGNFILLGDSSSNPWAQLFSDNRFNFRFINLQPQNVIAIQNSHPKRGEPILYGGAMNGGQGFARVAVVRNLTNTGVVLLIAGTSMESTEAATSFCLDAQESQRLLDTLGVGRARPVPPFEAVLQTLQESGTGLKAELVAARILRTEQ